MDNKILLSELAEKLAVQSEISKRAAESFLRTFFSLIEQNMLNDRFVKIKDIGTFKLVDVNDRESVNVVTGERIQIESHSKISFVAEGKLRDLVNRPFAYLTNIELEEETTIEELNSVDKAVPAEKSLSEQADATITDAAEAIAPTTLVSSVTPPVQESVENFIAKPIAPAKEEINQPLEPATQEVTQVVEEVVPASQTATQVANQDEPKSAPTPAAPAQPEETTEEPPVVLGRRERRRARRDGKRLKTAARQIAETPVTVAAAPAATIETKVVEEPEEAPTAEEEAPIVTAEEEETQRPLRLKDRQNRRRRNRPEIKRVGSADNEEKERSSIDVAEDEKTVAVPAEQEIAVAVSTAEQTSDDEKKRFKKIGIIVAIALLLLGFAFYFCYYHVPQKELIEDPLGLEQVKKANAADNVNVDTIQAQELNGQDMQTANVVDENNSDAAADDSKNIKQLPNAGYEILGTFEEHTMKCGETLNYVALKAFGSADLVNYIIFYNDLTNISNLEPGSKIKIPTLRRRSSGKIINKK